MPRISPDPIIRGDDWDPDEQAVLKGSYGYLELQRASLAIDQMMELTRGLTAASSEDDVLAASKAFARVIILVYRDVTLRKPGQLYQEGVDRPKVDFTEDGLIGPDVGTATLGFLSNKGMAHFREKNPVDTAPAPITAAAKEAGLTPANFPLNGADQSVLSAGKV